MIKKKIECKIINTSREEIKIKLQKASTFFLSLVKYVLFWKEFIFESNQKSSEEKKFIHCNFKENILDVSLLDEN